MFKKLVVRGLIPALAVSGALAVAALAPSVGANSFMTTAYTGPCTSVTDAANPTSVAQGVHSTITATATCPNPSPLIEFWMLPAGGSSWIMVQGFGTSTTYDWNSTGAAAGAVRFAAWARDASQPGSSYDVFTANPATVTVTTPACSGVTDSANPTAVANGVHSTITAVATGCSTTPRYEFWMLPAGGSSWILVQSYGTSATYDWNSAGAAAGNVRFAAWVRDANSSAAYDAFTANPATVAVSAAACTGVTNSANPTAVTGGLHSTITAVATGCATTPRYEFWMLPAGGSTWILVQSWGTSATYDWNSTGAATGNVRFSTWVRDANSSAQYDAFTANPATVTVT